MKKWQKISGLVALVVLAIVNFVIYGSSFMQTMYTLIPQHYYKIFFLST